MLLGSSMRMRPTKKLLFVLTLSGAALTLVSYLARCSTRSPLSAAEPLLMQADSSSGISMGAKGKVHLTQEIKCVINDDYAVPCRKEGPEVYVPFSFVRKYFDVYGKVSYRDGKEVLDWQHSYSKVMAPTSPYQTAGPFLWFENYNVAVRDRVKCISGVEGVPISTQWDPKGHFYPVQIAQFGLSHFSKNLSEPTPSVAILENGVRAQHGSWVASSRLKATYSRLRDDETEGHVFEFRTSEEKEVPNTGQRFRGVLLTAADHTVLLFSAGASYVAGTADLAKIALQALKKIIKQHLKGQSTGGDEY